eukprot:1485946-Rhodomonas_salina.1
MKIMIHVTFPVTCGRRFDFRQKFRFLSVGTPTGTSAEFAEFNCKRVRQNPQRLTFQTSKDHAAS